MKYIRFSLTLLAGLLIGYATSIVIPPPFKIANSQHKPKSIYSDAIDEIIYRKMPLDEVTQLLGKPSLNYKRDNHVTFLDYMPPEYCIESDPSKGVRIQFIDGEASSRSDVLYSKH
jgi:hypothetical protein